MVTAHYNTIDKSKSTDYKDLVNNQSVRLLFIPFIEIRFRILEYFKYLYHSL